MSRMLAIGRHDLRLIRNNPAHFIVLVLMPIVLMGFIRSVSQAALVAEGVPDANGSEQAVPGMAAMFGFYIVGTVAHMFFGEHAWNTWPRLRVTETRQWEILVGKALGPFVIGLVQVTVLFAAGAVLFDLHVSGSLPALALTAVAMVWCLTAIGLALSAFAGSWLQVQTFNNLGALLFAGIGGALTPRATLPEWAQHVSVVTPTYWAMTGFQRVIITGGGIREVLVPVAILVGAGTVIGTAAGVRLRLGERKVAWN
jgi:ABC-2 type transport system permease protein